jgi:trk system potassium uptake protein TrkA
MRQFAVIGLGRFGSSVATTLHEMGYEVLAVDSNEELVQKMADHVTQAVQADARDEDALKALGIRNFDVVVVAIGSDIQASILITLMLKEMGVKQVIAKTLSEMHSKVLQKIGADKVVFPERDMGARLAHSLGSTNVLDYIELSPKYSIVEVVVPVWFVGKTLSQAEFRARHGVNVVAIRRGKEIIVSPGADCVLVAGDILVAVGANENLRLLELEE